MKKSFMVYPVKFAFAFFIALFLVAMALCLIVVERWTSVLVFFVLSLPFFYIAAIYGMKITMTDVEIKCSLFGKIIKQALWSEIHEVGVLGTSVFSKKKTGTIFIYLSKEPLDDERRFRLAFNWPPKDMIFFVFTHKRITDVQMIWSSKIATTHVGDLKI